MIWKVTEPNWGPVSVLLQSPTSSRNIPRTIRRSLFKIGNWLIPYFQDKKGIWTPEKAIDMFKFLNAPYWRAGNRLTFWLYLYLQAILTSVRTNSSLLTSIFCFNSALELNMHLIHSGFRMKRWASRLWWWIVGRWSPIMFLLLGTHTQIVFPGSNVDKIRL